MKYRGMLTVYEILHNKLMSSNNCFTLYIACHVYIYTLFYTSILNYVQY